MKTNLKQIKTKRPKKAHEMTFHQKIASQVGCSERMVLYVLSGQTSQETATAQKVLLAAAIIAEEENKLLQEVKRLVNF